MNLLGDQGSWRNCVCMTCSLSINVHIITCSSEYIHIYIYIYIFLKRKLSVELGKTCYTSCFPSDQLHNERAILSASN